MVSINYKLNQSDSSSQKHAFQHRDTHLQNFFYAICVTSKKIKISLDPKRQQQQQKNKRNIF